MFPLKDAALFHWSMIMGDRVGEIWPFFMWKILLEVNLHLPGNPKISHLWKGNIFKHGLVTGYGRSDFPSGKAKTLKAHISWWLVWVKVGAKTDCCQDLGTGNVHSILALQSAIGWGLNAESNREVIEQLLVIFQQGSWKIPSKYQEKKQEEQQWLSKNVPSSYFLCQSTSLKLFNRRSTPFPSPPKKKSVTRANTTTSVKVEVTDTFWSSARWASTN